MKKSIMTKLRKFKNKLIVVSGVSFPNDIDSFIKEIDDSDVVNIDDFERSFLAYKIQKKYTQYSFLRKVAIVIFSSFSLVVLMFMLIFKRVNKYKDSKIVYYKISHNKGILPKAYENTADLKIVEFGSGMSWDKEVRRVLFKIIKRYGFYPDFLLNVLFSLANYNYIIRKYHPNEIVTSYESSISCAILTYYCHQHGISHVNIMHGEKLLTQNNVLGHFDVMYMWDSYYVELFRRLKYETGEYKIYNPWHNIELPMPTEKHDLIFYLNFINEKECHNLICIIEKLSKKGFDVIVRMHPSQLRTGIAERLEKSVKVENNSAVSIFQSIANAQRCVSQFSTVLYQAYNMGKTIVIDDVTNPSIYDKICKLDYIMLQKKNVKLSELI